MIQWRWVGVHKVASSKKSYENLEDSRGGRVEWNIGESGSTVETQFNGLTHLFAQRAVTCANFNELGSDSI